MRITRETLLKIARDTAAERVRISRRLVCIYLTGSLLSNDPLLGGTADIDLFFIHDSDPLTPREIIRLTDEVHLDIAHLSQTEFSQPRRLRLDAWLGHFICTHPLVLHDSNHWFDFTQATISAQFFQPENTLKRARALAEDARQRWMSLHEAEDFSPDAPLSYLKALEQGGNAIAVLSGAPLTERRFLTQLPQRAAALQRPDLASDLVALLLQTAPEPAQYAAWLPAWKTALQAAARQPQCPASLHPARRMYYERAAQALLEETPPAALWLMLRTGCRAAFTLPADDPARAGWQPALDAMGLSAAGLPDRLPALDQYLDRIEEMLDAWGKRFGG